MVLLLFVPFILVEYGFSSSLTSSVEWSGEVYWAGPQRSMSALKLQAAFFDATPIEKVEFLHNTITLPAALSTGFELKLYDFLIEPHSFSEICDKFHLEDRAAEALMTTLIGSNFLVQDPTTKLISLANDFEDDQDGGRFENIVTFLKLFMTRELYYLTESAQANEPIGLRAIFGSDVHDLYALRSTNPSLAKVWDVWMDGGNPNLERDMRPLFDELPNTSEVQVLDICGNDGSNAMRLAKAQLEAQFVMADLPGQVAKATHSFANAGLQGRIHGLSVDLSMDQIDFGTERFHAAYMLHAVSVFDFPTVKKIFRSVYAALRPGGHFMFDTVTGMQPGTFRANYINMLPIYFLTTATPTHLVKHYPDFVRALTEIGFRDLRLFGEGVEITPSDEIFYKFDSFAWRQLYLQVKK